VELAAAAAEKEEHGLEGCFEPAPKGDNFNNDENVRETFEVVVRCRSGILLFKEVGSESCVFTLLDEKRPLLPPCCLSFTVVESSIVSFMLDCRFSKLSILLVSVFRCLPDEREDADGSGYTEQRGGGGSPTGGEDVEARSTTQSF
jgi:hypothetical protein